MSFQFYRKPKQEPFIRRIGRAIWQRRLIRWPLLIGVPILAFVTFSTKGIVARMHLEAEKKVWVQKAREAEAEQLRLREISQKLEESSVRNDSSSRELIEKIAREKHGMIRPGETVYRFRKKE